MYTDRRLTVPGSFQVNEGGGGRVITVQGPIVRVEPPLGKSRTFSVREAARLIVRQPKGRSFENVLLGTQGRPLCRFTLSEKNGEVFLQYLMDQGVPFFRPDGRPLEIVRPSEPVSGPRFTLQLRRTAPVGMWLALGFGLTLVLFLVGIPVAVALGGSHIEQVLGILLVMILVSIVSPWICAAAVGQLFPPMLTLEGERMWITRNLGRRELCLEEMDCIRFQRSDECYILYNNQGRAVAKFSTRDDFGPQLMDFLISRNIRLCSGK